MNCFNDPPLRTENPFQTVNTHVRQSKLARLNNRTHVVQRREELRKALVVMDRIRLDEPQRGAETNRLADRHSGLHSGMTGKRGDQPQLASRVRGKQGSGESNQFFMTRLFTSKWEEGNPDAGSERTRRMLRHFYRAKGTRIYPEDRLLRKEHVKRLDGSLITV